MSKRDKRAARYVQQRDRPRREGVNPTFDDRALHRDARLRKSGQADACRGTDPPFDKVDEGEHLADRVLDLKADVHLHEPEVPVRVAQEFKRARARIADGADGVRHGGKERCARLAVDRRGRGFLEQLLVAALDGAVALAEADDMAFLVGEDLHPRCGARDGRIFQDKRLCRRRRLHSATARG